MPLRRLSRPASGHGAAQQRRAGMRPACLLVLVLAALAGAFVPAHDIPAPARPRPGACCACTARMRGEHAPPPRTLAVRAVRVRAPPPGPPATRAVRWLPGPRAIAAGCRCPPGFEPDSWLPLAAGADAQSVARWQSVAEQLCMPYAPPVPRQEQCSEQCTDCCSSRVESDWMESQCKSASTSEGS